MAFSCVRPPARPPHALTRSIYDRVEGKGGSHVRLCLRRGKTSPRAADSLSGHRGFFAMKHPEGLPPYGIDFL